MDIHDFDNNLDSINLSHDWQSDLHTPSDLHNSSNLSDYSDTGIHDPSHNYNSLETDYSNDYHSYHNDSYSEHSSFGDTYSSTHETNSLYADISDRQDWDDRQENSFQYGTIENNPHQTTWVSEYHNQYGSVNEDDRYHSTAENHFQQTSWEAEDRSQYASPRSGLIDSQDVEKAQDLLKQAAEERSVAEYRMNGAKEFADKNSPDIDSVNKYLDKTTDALKDAEKHEAEAKKILEGK